MGTIGLISIQCLKYPVHFVIWGLENVKNINFILLYGKIKNVVCNIFLFEKERYGSYCSSYCEVTFHSINVCALEVKSGIC